MELKYVLTELGSEWDEQIERLGKVLRDDGIECLQHHSDFVRKKSVWQQAVLLTDNRETARRYGHEVVCIGCERNGMAFFDGAVLVMDTLEVLDAVFLEEIMLHAQGRPVTIAETERLVIREIAEEDFETLYRISVQDGMEYAFWSNVFEPERLAAYISHVYRFYGYGLWSVLKKDGTLIGCCGLSEFEMPDAVDKLSIDTRHPGTVAGKDTRINPETGKNVSCTCLELQYMLSAPYQGQGYAQEMCRAALGYAVARTDWTEVWIRTRRENERSVRTAERLGFEWTAEQGNMKLFRLLLDKWML